MLLGVLLLAAFSLRVVFPSRLGITHFDEGVYASNVWFGPESHFRYPFQYLYAPPLVPALIEALFLVTGPTQWGGAGWSILAGMATVAALWWFMRRAFGEVAALSAAAVLAGSDLHIFFCRTALTDALLGLWLVAGVGACWAAFVHPSIGRILVAGVLIALGWWTKYNGWLPLAISLTGLILLWAARMPDFDRRRAFLTWSGMALVAGLAWSPVLWDLQDVGGYRVVAANHRGYIVGWEGWPAALGRQAFNLAAISGPLSRWDWVISLVIGAAWACISHRPRSLAAHQTATASADPRPERSPRTLVKAVHQFRQHPEAWGVGVLCLLTCSGACSTIWLAGWGLARGLFFILGVLGLVPRGTCETDAEGGHCLSEDGQAVACLTFGSPLLQWAVPATRIAAALVLAWVGGLAVATFLYTPYPRLLLPLSLGCCAVWGLGVQAAVSKFRGDRPSTRGWRFWDVLPALLIVAGLTARGLDLAPAGLAMDGTPAWEDRRDLGRAAQTIIEQTQRTVSSTSPERGAPGGQAQSPCLYLVHGSPALFFQLHLAGAEHVSPLGNLDFLRSERGTRVPTFLIMGGNDETEIEAALHRAVDALAPVAEVTHRLSRLELLDEADVGPRSDPERLRTIRVFRCR